MDVSIQAQILELMRELCRERAVGMILITHDLGVIAEQCDDVVVMYAGKVVERAGVAELFSAPKHPYTQGLLQSLPGLHLEHERLPSVKGSVPSLNELPGGCPFHPRCPQCRPGLCDGRTVPALESFGAERAAACFRIKELQGVPA